MDESSIKLFLNLSWQKLETLATSLLAGKEVYNEVFIDNISITGSEKGLNLSISLKGLVSRTMTFKGKVDFDNENKKVKLDDMQPGVQGAGLLSKTLNWIVGSVASDRIVDSIEDKINEHLDQLLTDYLNKDQNRVVFQQIELNLHLNDFEIKNILHDESGISFNLSIFGAAWVN